MSQTDGSVNCFSMEVVKIGRWTFSGNHLFSFQCWEQEDNNAFSLYWLFTAKKSFFWLSFSNSMCHTLNFVYFFKHLFLRSKYPARDFIFQVTVDEIIYSIKWVYCSLMADRFSYHFRLFCIVSFKWNSRFY